MGHAHALNNQSDGYDAIMDPATEVAGCLLELPEPKSRNLATLSIDLM